MDVSIQKQAEINITKTDFKKYVEVQDSGKTNMLDIRMVSILSGLTTQKIRAIIEHYEELYDNFFGADELE